MKITIINCYTWNDFDNSNCDDNEDDNIFMILITTISILQKIVIMIMIEILLITKNSHHNSSCQDQMYRYNIDTDDDCTSNDNFDENDTDK